jgi:tRNA(adenine34) deaminase
MPIFCKNSIILRTFGYSVFIFMKLARDYMEMAIDEAKIAAQNEDVPVGCVIVHNDDVIANSHNQVVADGNPLAHAEMLAIKQAITTLGNRHLNECDLYVTLEPCSMCAGAIVLARIRRVYIGAEDSKTGAAGSVYNILQDRRLNHYCDVYSGIRHDECSKLLSDFFTALRQKTR